MNVFCSTDDNYAQYCAVMLTSLFENNRDSEVCVYLMTEGLSQDNRSLIARVADRYEASVKICDIDGSLFEKCPVRENDKVTLATYFRFLIPDLLPDDQHRAIYLDVDMIVLGSLRPLWEIDLTGYGVAAVDESGCYADDVFPRLGIPRENSYFNAGMLVINVDYWRRNGISRALFDYVDANAPKLTAHDQDTLNVVLNTNWLSLPSQWNWMSTFMHIDHKILPARYEEVMEGADRIRIIHYTECKPWVRFSHPPFHEH